MVISTNYKSTTCQHGQLLYNDITEDTFYELYNLTVFDIYTATVIAHSGEYSLTMLLLEMSILEVSKEDFTTSIFDLILYSIKELFCNIRWMHERPQCDNHHNGKLIKKYVHILYITF